MGLIYVLGIKLAFILRIFAYRKKIIDNNLKNAFPKKENPNRNGFQNRKIQTSVFPQSLYFQEINLI